MKKVILSAAALMIGALSYGQVSGAPQAQSQTTVANNSGNPQANKGKSEQTGTNHRVRVRQAGTKQSVYTLQTNGSTTIGNNRAEILQSGNVQPSLSGRKNAADVIQNGKRNSSKIKQEGDLNNAITQQGTSDLGSARNKAYIRQGTGQQAEKNYAAIDQDGKDNQAQTIQTYDNNDAWTDQDGTNHRSRIRQIASPNGSMGHWAKVDQNDDGQTSFVRQEGAGARNFAHTAQAGLNNYADQHQISTASTGNSNKAEINQGIASTLQYSASTDLINLFLATAGIMPLPGSVSVYSELAKAFQYQEGHKNEAHLGQYGGAIRGVGNYGEQSQIGDYNDAFLVQNYWGASPAGANKAQQNQYGDNNAAGIIQSGAKHRASQFQDGDNNTALTAQRGLGNKAFTFQYGNNNYGSIAQRGQHNKAVLSQYGGQSYVVEQNVTDGWPNGYNQVDVIQMGPAGTYFGDDAASCLIDMEEMKSYPRTPMASTPDICTDCR